MTRYANALTKSVNGYVYVTMVGVLTGYTRRQKRALYTE
jgi:hypothetical protein